MLFEVLWHRHWHSIWHSPHVFELAIHDLRGKGSPPRLCLRRWPTNSALWRDLWPETYVDVGWFWTGIHKTDFRQNHGIVSKSIQGIVYRVYSWLVDWTYPSEKYEFVSWDDDIPNMESHKIPLFQTTNQIESTVWGHLLWKSIHRVDGSWKIYKVTVDSPQKIRHIYLGPWKYPWQPQRHGNNHSTWEYE